MTACSTLPADGLTPALDSGPGGATAEPPAKEEPRVTEFDPAQLEGADSKVAELAAHRLIQAIATKNPSDDATIAASRAAHLNYLLEKLQPARLTQAALQGSGGSSEFVSAERIVDALATWIASSGPPFAKASEIVQPLLGVGPASFRDAVLRAHKAMALHELKAAKRRDLEPHAPGSSSATLSALAVRFGESPPPPEAFVRDACDVLWETDGKTLLSTLVGVLVLHSGAPPGTQTARMASMCAAELQSRVSLSFPTVEGWQQWWNESKELPLDRILADCQKRGREEYLATWRQLLRRLRETGDAERLLQGIQDSLDGSAGGELRVAAVSALGDYAEWVLDMRPSVAPGAPPAGAGPAPGASASDSTDRLLAKGAQRLTAFFENGRSVMERPDVLRAALAALRKYHAFLERAPQLLGVVSRIVVDRIQLLSLDGSTKDREDLLEIIRVAGALRVTQAQAFVEAILREERPAQDEDLEVPTAAVTALGRLLEKGASSDIVTLLVGHFRKQRQAPEKSVRELRRACVSALNVGSEKPEVRADLRVFFKELLPGIPAEGAVAVASPRGEKELRIPAILGLGTLARQKDTGSFELLVEVISHDELYERQEVIAAIDSVAYVGGRPAIAAFLRALGDVNDKSVEEHLWKKVVGLVEQGGGAALVATLESLESRAIEDDSTAPLERSVALCSAPQVLDLLSTEKLDPSSNGRLESLWKASLALVRAQDALGKDEESTQLLERMTGLLEKTQSARDRLPDGAASLAALKASIAQRAALKGKLPKTSASDPMPILREIDLLLSTDSSLCGRWRNLGWMLRQIPAGPMYERLRELWRTTLSSEQGRAVWQGFPPSYRDRFLARLAKPE